MPKYLFIKLFLIFIFFLLLGNGGFAQEITSPSIEPPVPVIEQKVITSPKPDIKITTAQINQPKDKTRTNFYSEKYKNLPPRLKMIGRFIKKYNHSITYCIAIIGMIGTFMGLCSTWLIYHLNKKNNDPFVIDRKDGAIRYIEAIDAFREVLSLKKLERLYSLIGNIADSTITKTEADELTRLVSYYIECTRTISQISLFDAHNRYKKHIKHRNINIYKSLITNYKIIEAESVPYENEDFRHIQVIKILEEKNIAEWKQKIDVLISFAEKIEAVRYLLHKNLKK